MALDVPQSGNAQYHRAEMEYVNAKAENSGRGVTLLAIAKIKNDNNAHHLSYRPGNLQAFGVKQEHEAAVKVEGARPGQIVSLSVFDRLVTFEVG